MDSQIRRFVDSPKAALRGEPSYVWRAGQERRLDMIRQAGGERLRGRVLVDGCGVGTYVARLAVESPQVHGLDIEFDRVREGARVRGLRFLVNGDVQKLPYPCDSFDLILSHEVIEHVQDDRAALAEMVRVLRPGGRVILFCPNRWYPVETHGIYWRGKYRFGNIPLVNYLPNSLRNRLAPHVRAYTTRSLRGLFRGLPVRIVRYTIIFGGYDNLIARAPHLGRLLRAVLYLLERTPLRALGLSHFLVVEKPSSLS